MMRAAALAGCVVLVACGIDAVGSAGPASGANVGGYTYFNAGNAVITLPVAASTTKRTLTF